MAREYEPEAAPMKELAEPMYQRVLMLEKQLREMREQLAEIDALLREINQRASRDLGWEFARA